MKKNIFEDAKFADKFITRDGRKVAYIIESDFGYPGFNCYACAVEGKTELYHYDYSGECIRGIEFYNENAHIPFDIVSRYQEPITSKEIDEDKLDELARKETGCLDPTDVDDPNYCGYHCYAAGYRKAMEE